jgi:hypothetical protein
MAQKTINKDPKRTKLSSNLHLKIMESQKE